MRGAWAQKKRPCEEKARRWPCASRGKRHQNKSTLLAPWSGPFSSRTVGKINFYCLQYPESGIFYGSLRKLTYFLINTRTFLCWFLYIKRLLKLGDAMYHNKAFLNFSLIEIYITEERNTNTHMTLIIINYCFTLQRFPLWILFWMQSFLKSLCLCLSTYLFLATSPFLSVSCSNSSSFDLDFF